MPSPKTNKSQSKSQPKNPASNGNGDIKKLFDRIDEIEKTNIKLHEGCQEVHEELRGVLAQEQEKRLAQYETLEDKVDRNMENHHKDLENLQDEVSKLSRGTMKPSLKEKCVVAGLYVLAGGLTLAAVIKLGRMPKAEPHTFIIGKMSDEVGKAAAASIKGEIVSKGVDEAITAVLN